MKSYETGVSLTIPVGAIPFGNQQEIYFKVCQEGGQENNDGHRAPQTAGDKLISPMVMCGPHGIKFMNPVELRLPHSVDGNIDSTTDEVKILIDHF